MTALVDALGPTEPVESAEPDERRQVVETDDAPPSTPEAVNRPPLRPARVVAVWIALTLVGIVVVSANVGPITEEREQRHLLQQYRSEIKSASNEAFGLGGAAVPTEAPSRGAPVAVVDIGRLGVRRVVVEGTEPGQTRRGPGHVVGTGAPGQPGNSVIVGRRTLFGGSFGSVGSLRVGDDILVTTVQGQSAYRVSQVGTHELRTADPDAQSDTAGGTAVKATLPKGPLTVDQVYGPSPDNRLTLVTSASGTPWSGGKAVVVVAKLRGTPFGPTPQGGRTAGDDGRQGHSPFSAALILTLLAFVAAVVGATWLYRKVPWRSAYLLTAPLLVALLIILAEQLATTLPAWA